MIQIEDKADITKGPGGEPALFCETRLYTRPAFELKKAYIEKISAAFAEITGVKPEKMYTTILEIDEWGSGAADTNTFNSFLFCQNRHMEGGENRWKSNIAKIPAARLLGYTRVKLIEKDGLYFKEHGRHGGIEAL